MDYDDPLTTWMKRAKAAEARVAELAKRCHDMEAENDKLRASNAQLMAERERAADLLAHSLGEEG